MILELERLPDHAVRLALLQWGGWMVAQDVK